MKPECSLNSHQVCLALGVHFSHYQKKYDPINNGWNKIVAPITIYKIDVSAVQITLNGEISSYQSVDFSH